MYRNIYDNNIAYKNDIAIMFNGFKTSYGKMFEMIDKYAKALKANGINKGDCVSMCLSYTPEAVCLVLACSKIGALANFINPLFTTEQKIARLNEAESKVRKSMFWYLFRCLLTWIQAGARGIAFCNTSLNANG